MMSWEYASNKKMLENPVLLNLNYYNSVVMTLLVKFLTGGMKNSLSFEESASHGGTSKKIKDAKNLMPSYRF